MVFATTESPRQSTPSMGAFAGAMAVAVPAWWLVLHLSPSIRSWFVPEDAWPEFRIVLLPDLALALITAYLAVRLWQGRASGLHAGLVCGAWGYATCWAMAWSLEVGAPVTGGLLMIAATGALGTIARDLAAASATGVD